MAKTPKTQYTKEFIQNLLETNDRAVMRGVVAIWKRQTASEQSQRATQCDNGVGFTGVDAGLLSSFAEQIIQRGTLSVKQMYLARKKIPKYWRQLQEIAVANDAVRAVQSLKQVEMEI